MAPTRIGRSSGKMCPVFCGWNPSASIALRVASNPCAGYITMTSTIPSPAHPGMPVLPIGSTLDHGAAPSIRSPSVSATSIAARSYATYAAPEFEYGRIRGLPFVCASIIAAASARVALRPSVPPRLSCRGDCNPYTQSSDCRVFALVMASYSLTVQPLIDGIVDAVEDLVAGVPPSREKTTGAPGDAAKVIARKAASRAAAVSGALALPPGVLGLLTVVPDLVAIWRIQAQM